MASMHGAGTLGRCRCVPFAIRFSHFVHRLERRAAMAGEDQKKLRENCPRDLSVRKGLDQSASALNDGGAAVRGSGEVNQLVMSLRSPLPPLRM